MNLLLLAQVCASLPTPDFGGDFPAHLSKKRHPELRCASLTAWNLLACGLRMLNVPSLPEIAIAPRGKPCFLDSPLNFSLSHSGDFAAALLSDAPCSVDLERVRPEVAQRMRARCLNAQEQAEDMDFFECWTKKECIAKLDGRGMHAHPTDLNVLDPQYLHRFHCERIQDSAAREYVLSALCDGAEALNLRWISPEALAGMRE